MGKKDDGKPWMDARGFSLMLFVPSWEQRYSGISGSYAEPCTIVNTTYNSIQLHLSVPKHSIFSFSIIWILPSNLCIKRKAVTTGTFTNTHQLPYLPASTFLVLPIRDSIPKPALSNSRVLATHYVTIACTTIAIKLSPCLLLLDQRRPLCQAFLHRLWSPRELSENHRLGKHGSPNTYNKL